MNNLGNDKQDSNDKAYADGYESGKNGNFYDDIVQSVAKGWCTSSESKCHDKGYYQGVADRHKDK